MSTTSVTLSAQSVLTKTACSNCGTQISHPGLEALQDAQARIQELESQVKILTLRATSAGTYISRPQAPISNSAPPMGKNKKTNWNAVERATEFEISVKRMASNASQNSQNKSDGGFQAQASPVGDAFPSTPPPKPVAQPSRLARLLSTRTASAPVVNTSTSAPNAAAAQQAQKALPPGPAEIQLRDQLSHEQSLRKAAESAAAQTNSEIEELTAQLFEQANEMVAAERKSRAKLEARVEVLEKRDNDKAKRLGLLEMRVQRVERVRGLLEGEKGS